MTLREQLDDLTMRIKAWRTLEAVAREDRDFALARDHQMRAETLENYRRDLVAAPITVVRYGTVHESPRP
jgi:hypothetical protein